MRSGAVRSFVVVAAVGCGPRHTAVDAVGDDDDDGPSGAIDGTPGPDAGNCGELIAHLRDFRADHPDFEGALGDDRGLVMAQLGTDRKPIYAPGGATATVSGAASFDQWYRDVDGVNMPFDIAIMLTEAAPGQFVFEDLDFYPLDGMGWPGEEVNGHNYHFTTELHGTFLYRGGETFTFTGDDDVFVFVNDRLALDLGGVHGVEAQTIDFDASAAALGIAPGTVYPLDVFHAERHTTESNFRIETSIECLVVD
jgi:fibro-slime domain-containing protein